MTKTTSPKRERSPILLEGTPPGSFPRYTGGRRRIVKAKRNDAMKPPAVSKKSKVKNYDDSDVETDVAFSQFQSY